MALIFGHRGASADAPENTLEAFALAAEQGAAGVELDVHLSRDGELVVAHDERLERVSDGVGFIKDMTLAQLKRLRFNRTHPEYARAAIPTLREVYELLRPTGLQVNVELKNSEILYEGLEEKCAALAAEMGMTERVLYSSFNHHSLAVMRRIDPSLPFGLLYSATMVESWRYAAAIGADAIHPCYTELLVPGEVEQCHALGLRVNVWTPNADDDLRFCLRCGADIIITDRPARGLELLEEARRDGL